jgi:eukaryotic-like serine/threonine-protein kinase
MDIKNQPSCRSVQFDLLLFGDEQSAEYRNSAAHVEACRHCQDSLAKLAADEGDWSNVRTMLRRDDSDAASESKLQAALSSSGFSLGSHPRQIKLDFLDPPSHPEMLGRLDRYQIEQVLGKGGMGIVLKGFDTELNRPVAIKVLAPHLAHSGAARQRFSREARAAASIVHEHVVAIHDVKSELESPYLVMQYVPGHSLQERVDHNGPLAATEILRIGMQAAAGLAAAHAQGVIHRDVKPANILLENGVDRALLTDFGLARAADDATLTHSGIIAGTPHYMSPEQARGAQADARSDLFGLGGVLYFMATGHPPFRAEQAMAILHRICQDQHRPVQEINPSIPDDLADTIDRLLEKKPARRFANAGELQQSLAQALAQIQQRPRKSNRRWHRRLLRRRWRIPVAAGAIFCVVIIAWLAGGLGRPPGVGPAENARTSREPIAVDEQLVNSAAAERADATQITNELAAISWALSQIENSPSRGSLSNISDPSWQNALQAADTEAARLERHWSVESKNNSPRTSINGENP